MADARSRATEKYRKANVKSFNVKFFPADADILEYFQAKSNRNQYIKNLIRRDMEAAESPMPAVNKADADISVLHEHIDSSAGA